MRFRRTRSIGLTLAAFLTVLSVEGCAGKTAPELIGTGGVLAVATIGDLAKTIDALEMAGTLPTPAALNAQKKLLDVNTSLEPLPDLIRLLNAAIEASAQVDQSVVDKAIAILQSVAPTLATVLQGVPVGPAVEAIVSLVRQAHQTITEVLVQLARLKAV